jgi:hypothetical protein
VEEPLALFFVEILVHLGIMHALSMCDFHKIHSHCKSRIWNWNSSRAREGDDVIKLQQIFCIFSHSSLGNTEICDWV